MYRYYQNTNVFSHVKFIFTKNVTPRFIALQFSLLLLQKKQFLLTKILTVFVKSNWFTMSFAKEILARDDRRSCIIVERK